MCGIVNDVDVRKADDADNEQAEPHRKDSLDNTDIFDGNRKMGGVGHEKPLLDRHFSRTWIRLRPLFFHFPGDISTGEVKVHATRNICATNLGACRRSEGAFMGVKKDLAIPGLRAQPQQRPERPAMHHAEAEVIVRLKHQRIDVMAPGCRTAAAVQAVCPGSMPADPSRSPGTCGRRRCDSGLALPRTDRSVAFTRMVTHRHRLPFVYFDGRGPSCARGNAGRPRARVAGPHRPQGPRGSQPKYRKQPHAK